MATKAGGAVYRQSDSRVQYAAFALAATVLIGAVARPPVLLYASALLAAPQSAVYAFVEPFAQPSVANTAQGAQTDFLHSTPVPTVTPTAVPSATPQAVYAPSVFGNVALIPDTGAPEGSGRVIEKHYTQGTDDRYIPLGASSIQNFTSYPRETLLAEIEKGLPFAVEKNSVEPQVLIMHTHATECYRPYEGLYFDLDDSARTTDTSLDMCAVGAAVAQTLNDAGINTLHDTALNDYPSYNASYDNSRAVVQAYLAQYPSIRVVIDVHRDAIESGDVRYAPVTQFGETQTAQVMIIAGCDNGGSISLPNCMENLRFAAAWQEQMEESYAGLTRSAMFAHRFYNQDLTTGSLLLEVGGHGNTLSEAIGAAERAASALAQVLCGQ